MELELYLMEAEEKMKESIEGYESNLSKISTGRANPNLLNGVKVDYFESMTPINQLSSITVPENNQLLIKPFDPTIVKLILGAINAGSLSVQGVDEGHQIRITFPELTTDRRKEMVKSLSKYTEQSKIMIRSARQEINKSIKLDDELSEDDERYFLEEIQKLTNKYIDKVGELTREKEKELMSL